MKFFILMLLIVSSGFAFAHHDHLVSDSTLHLMSHIALIVVVALCGYFGLRMYRKMKNSD